MGRDLKEYSCLPHTKMHEELDEQKYDVWGRQDLTCGHRSQKTTLEEPSGDVENRREAQTFLWVTCQNPERTRSHIRGQKGEGRNKSPQVDLQQ